MLRKHASLIIAFCLIGLVTTACLVRTTPVRRTGQPVYVEKHKGKKHKHKKVKHKKHRKHR